MQRTIIALWGISNLGKTTTIRLAYQLLKAEYACVCEGRRVRRSRRPSMEVRGAILEIDGVKVGFASPGDVADVLDANLLPLIDADCGVIVCATHTRGGTVQLVQERASRAEPPYEIVWIKKACEQLDHDDGNRKKADEIIAVVRRAVAKAQQAQLVEA